VCAEEGSQNSTDSEKSPRKEGAMSPFAYWPRVLVLLSFLLLALLFFWYYPGWIVQDSMKVALFQKINPLKKSYREVLLTIRKPDGDFVSLENYKDAKNPSWTELVNFLRNDETDQKNYTKGAFVCSNFAEELHNNAEKAGQRAGFVIITFKGNPIGHTANVFDCTDKGRVFIDDTGLTFSSRSELKIIEAKVQKALVDKKDASLDPVLKKMMNNFLDYAASRKKYADNVAFLDKNRPYGFLPLDFPGLQFDYPYWERIKTGRESYRKRFESYVSDLKTLSGEYGTFSDSLALYNKRITDFVIRQKKYETRNAAFESQVARIPRKLTDSVMRYNPALHAYERIDQYRPDPEQVSLLKAEENSLRDLFIKLRDESGKLQSEEKRLNEWGRKLQQKIARLNRRGEEINRQVEAAGVSVFFNDREEIVEDFVIVW
jgi:hypothetical protein